LNIHDLIGIACHLQRPQSGRFKGPPTEETFPLLQARISAEEKSAAKRATELITEWRKDKPLRRNTPPSEAITSFTDTSSRTSSKQLSARSSKRRDRPWTDNESPYSLLKTPSQPLIDKLQSLEQTWSSVRSLTSSATNSLSRPHTTGTSNRLSKDRVGAFQESRSLSGVRSTPRQRRSSSHRSVSSNRSSSLNNTPNDDRSVTSNLTDVDDIIDIDDNSVFARLHLLESQSQDDSKQNVVPSADKPPTEAQTITTMHSDISELRATPNTTIARTPCLHHHPCDATTDFANKDDSLRIIRWIDILIERDKIFLFALLLYFYCTVQALLCTLPVHLLVLHAHFTLSFLFLHSLLVSTIST
jgi:hypothetical protein